MNSKIAMGENLPPLWLRFLPATLREKVKHRPNLLLALSNTGWLFGDKVLRMGVGLFIGAWIARHLGPTDYGALGYAIALVAIFQTAATLGLDNISIRDMSRSENQPEVILGTLVSLRGGAAVLAGLCATIAILSPASLENRHAVALLLVCCLPFYAVDVIDLRFQSRLESRYTVLAKGAAFVAGTILKIILLIVGAPLTAFALAILLEVSISGLALAYAYKLKRVDANWEWNRALAVKMLVEGFPILLAGIALTLYTQVDKIIIGMFSGETQVGIYVAASMVSGAFSIAPLVAFQSLAPKIATLPDISSRLDFFSRHGSMVMIAVCLVAITLMIFSKAIINLIFGGAYAAAGEILKISAISLVFQTLSIINDYYSLASGKVWATLVRTVSGLILSASLYIFLIPDFGAIGAAYSVLVAHMVSNTLVMWVALPETRTLHCLFFTQVTTLLPKFGRKYL